MVEAMLESIVIVGGGGGGGGGGVSLFLMLLLIIILILVACKPWRFCSPSSRSRPIKEDDVERPLVSEDLGLVQNQSTEGSKKYALAGSFPQSLRNFLSPRAHVACKQRLQPTAPQLTHSDSFVLDIPDSYEDTSNNAQTHSLATNYSAEHQKYHDSRFGEYDDTLTEVVPKHTADQRSILTLEVTSGPSCGLLCSIESTNKSGLPLTLGRVSPRDVVVKDSEVSGKHAMINWNSNKLKWELVDMGSLNGTLVNSLAVHHPLSGSRHRGDPIELASGDVITLGTTSNIIVQITSQTEQIPFGVGVASDPMAMRRGAKKLPMEDVCFYQWRLPGADQFGVFGICDGHGGAGAALSASKIIPKMVASVLSNSFRRERVLSQCDASDVLRDVFSQTEACMDHLYEGCTATVLLVWSDGHGNFCMQCANVGDSACVVNIDGKQIKMTDDHRITSHSERLRIQATGDPLKDGETRLCGLNLARMLGDKFLKQQDSRFSSEPYISQVVYIHQASTGFALLASDGFWDVVTLKKAVQLVHQVRERNGKDGGENPAKRIANYLLSEARTQRTKDNTSIIFLDFNFHTTTNTNRNFSCKHQT